MLAAAAGRLLQQWFIAIAAAATRRERQRVSRETEIKETSQNLISDTFRVYQNYNVDPRFPGRSISLPKLASKAELFYYMAY